MAKLRVVYRCLDCGTAFPKWGGQCGSCGAWNTLTEDVEGTEPVFTGGSLRTGGAGRAHRRGRLTGRRSAAHGHRRARPGAGRRHRAGFGHPARRRAGHRQVHAAAAAARLVARPHAVRQRRGERPAGALAGRAAGRHQPRPVAAQRDRAAAHHRLHRRGAARARRHRQHPDRQRPRARFGTRAAWCRCAAAPPGWRTKPRHRGIPVVLVGHVTKDGGARRAAGARAPGRRGAGVRGRAPPLAPAAARGEEPVRSHRRAGAVRDAREGPGRRARREPAVPRRPPHRRARLGRACPRSTGNDPSWSRCRRSPADPAPVDRRDATCRASTPGGSPCCSPCSSDGRA